MTIDSGTQFGAYTIEGPIAGGGMGQVYAARHNVYGSVVALKVLHKQLHADAEWRLRFNLEGVIGQQLKHPHVVAARELVEHEDHVAIVLDLVSGGLTLHRCISREYSGGLPLDQALRVFLAILQGVEYAHGKMVTHGDIKPENVLIEGAYRDPSTWVAKVTDFGTVGIMAHPVMIDGRAAVVVSPRYAAPEHLLGIDRIERRSDIYCLGLMLHYLLTGKHASTARTVEEAAVNTGKPLSMLALVDQPEPLRAIIQKACALDINERYAACGELAVAVRQAMDTLGMVFEVEDVAADLATEMMPERGAMRRGEPVDGLTLDVDEPLTTGSAQDGIETDLLGPDDIDPAVRAAGMFASEGADDEAASSDDGAESDGAASSDDGAESDGAARSDDGAESDGAARSDDAAESDGAVSSDDGAESDGAAALHDALDVADNAGASDSASNASDSAGESDSASDASDSASDPSEDASGESDSASNASDSAGESDSASEPSEDASGESDEAASSQDASDASDASGQSGDTAEPDDDDDDDDIDPRLDPSLANVDPNATFGGEFFTGENQAPVLDDEAGAASAPETAPSSGAPIGLILAGVAAVVVVLGIAAVLLSS